MSGTGAFGDQDRAIRGARASSRRRSTILDSSRLLELLGDARAETPQILDLFVRSTEGDLANLAAALTSRNSSRVANSAHRLKGAAGAIGAELLRREAARLEVLGLSGELAGAAECFARLQVEFDRFRTHVAGFSFPPS